jgi:hypothetical protein
MRPVTQYRKRGRQCLRSGIPWRIRTQTVEQIEALLPWKLQT